MNVASLPVAVGTPNDRNHCRSLDTRSRSRIETMTRGMLYDFTRVCALLISLIARLVNVVAAPYNIIQVLS